MGQNRKKKSSSFSFIKFVKKSFVFGSVTLICALVWLVACSYYWGIIGQVSSSHAKMILHSMLPGQRQELADSLNYHYENGVLARITKGPLLSCDSDVESIVDQFNWFYRDSVTATFIDMASYHEVVKASLVAAYGDADVESYDDSTVLLELYLINELNASEDPELTDKDVRSNFLSLTSLSLEYAVGITNPYVGLGLTAAGLIHNALPDPEKSIPAIICFHRLRLINWLVSAGFFFLLTELKVVSSFYGRRKKKKVTAKSKRRRA